MSSKYQKFSKSDEVSFYHVFLPNDVFCNRNTSFGSTKKVRDAYPQTTGKAYLKQEIDFVFC